MSYQDQYYQDLIGWKIVHAECVDYEDDGRHWPTLILENDQRQAIRVEVSCDPEGNGPGHLFIQHIEENQDERVN